MSMRTIGRGRITAAVTGVLIWAFIYGLALLGILHRSITGVAGGEGLSAATVRDVFTDGRLGRLALIGIGQAVVSTAIVVVLGVPLAWVIGRLEFPGRRFISALVMTPFVLPTLSIALAVSSLVGGIPDTWGGRFALIVAAHVVFNLGIMVRSVAPAVASSPPSLEHAARLLGHGPLAAVRAATVGQVRPAVVSAALIVAMFCLTSFGIIVALGGARISTIEVEVWVLTTRSLDLARAAVLVVAQLAVVLVLVAVAQRVRAHQPTRIGFARRRPASTGEHAAIIATHSVVALVVGLPLGALVWRSVRDADGFTLSHYSALPVDAIVRTVVWAVMAAVISIVIALPMVAAASKIDRLGRWCESAMMIPFSMSAATLGVGYLIGFGGPLLDLRGTWFIVPLVQAAAAAPVVVRILVGAVRSIDATQLDAAASCGAGAGRRLREIVWPALRRPFSVALGFAFAMSVGEFGATVFLARRDSPTVSVIIGRLVGRPGAEGAGRAVALSVVLALIAAASVLIADRGSEGPQPF